MNKDYYSILGVQKTATPQEIKKAYRALALANHPDKNPDNPQAEELFKSASEAYEILSDPEKKQKYDTYGNSPYDNASFDFRNFNGGDIFKDIFGGMFGGFGFSQPQPRERDTKNRLQYNMPVQLKLLLVGAKTKLKNVPVHIPCSSCDGSGTTADKVEYTTCQNCNGSGHVVQTAQNGGMFTQQISPCQSCHQTGKILSSPCSACNGSGHAVEIQELMFQISPGTYSGQQIQLMNNRLNEIRVQLRIAGDSDGYHLNDGHVITKNIDIELLTAIKGGEMTIPYLDGTDLSIQISEGTQDGQSITIPDKGFYMPTVNRKTDLILTVHVNIPKYSQLPEQSQKLFDNMVG